MPNAKQTLEYLVNESTGVFKDANEITAQQLRDMTVTAFAGLYSTTAQAVTTGNVNGVVGTMHVLDVSGMTANRDFLLPTTAAVGDRVGVMIKLGDATQELLLKTTSASSDTINGAVADTTEWSRLFITGEVVIFRCVVADTDWIVEYDGRIPCKAKGEDNAGMTLTNATFTTLEMPLSLIDIGGILDVTNDRFNIRRTGNYRLEFFCRSPNMGDQTKVSCRLWDGSAEIHYAATAMASVPSPNVVYVQGIAFETLTAGTSAEWQANQTSGSDQTASTTAFIRIWQSCEEIL